MRTFGRHRPSPALVVACLALLVALGGTSAAAVALVPRNSVGSRQVIDLSLQRGDIAPGQVLTVTDTFTVEIDGPVTPPSFDDFRTIASLPIPTGGTYLITSHARVDSNPGRGGACRLRAGDILDSSEVTSPAPTAELWNAAVQSYAAAGLVELQCNGYLKGPTTVSDIRITARQIDG